jgi:hypothetical protein
MNIKNKIKSITKKQAIIAGAAVVVLSGTAVALRPTDTGAEDKPPIITQVENHEKRIGDLEDKTDKTQAQTDQNTADITSQGGGSKPSTTTAAKTSSTSSTTSNPAQSSSPAPSSTTNPRTITSVQDDPSIGNGQHTCIYTLYDSVQSSQIGHYIQAVGSPCYSVGTVLPY